MRSLAALTTTVMLLAVTLPRTAEALVNREAVERNRVRQARRRSRRECEESFRKAHQIVFDSYGRVIRWPREPDEVDCEKHAKRDEFKCKVTSWTERKYRNEKEEHLQQQIRLDKQAELDREAGSDAESDMARRRLRVENKKRCLLYKEWKGKYEDMEEEKQFFKWLETEYADFAALRKLPLSKRYARKAKKLYRHIALQIHHDKLPSGCRDEVTKSMMVAILENAEKMKECIIEPHTCARDEL